MTFAFGMNDAFKPVFDTGKARLRYALFEKLLGPGVKAENKKAAYQEMKRLRYKVGNRFAVGAHIADDALSGWLQEELTGLSRNVNYVHTKYMLIDPLSSNPTVVTGSANFSVASSTANDENMLVIRGDTRVADIYLGEFLRLWHHFAFREWASSTRKPARAAPWLLDETDAWWKRHFGDTGLARHRTYFTG